MASLLAAVLAGGARAQSPSQSPPMPPPATQALARDILKELVEIDTVHDHGTRAAAEAVVRRLKAAGFPDQDVAFLPMPDHPEQAQVVVRLRAAAPSGKPVLWIGHLDVVEARREDWSVDPFKLTEQGGWFYGRGSVDMKGEDAAVLAALIRLKQEGFAPARDIVVALTTDEECCEFNGADWLLKTHRPLVDAGMAINPDSGGGSFQAGRRLYYGVETSEKVYLTFQLETTNRGGHSSEPRADNAIYQLAAGLGRVAAYAFPVQTTSTTRGYFAKIATLESGQTAADLKAVASPAPDAAAAGRLSADPGLNAHLRTTCVATQLSGGHAENALPQRARAVIQCRIMPDDTEARVRAQLVRALADPGIAVTTIWPAAGAPDSPLDAGLMARFTTVIHDEWPGVMVLPSMDVGASDSIYTRAAGIPSYGLAGIWTDIDDVRVHGRDERAAVPAFYEAVEFEYRLMKALTGP